MKLFVGYVHPAFVSHDFLKSILWLTNTPAEYTALISDEFSGPMLSKARNKLIRSFLSTDATHFLSVDTDIRFTPIDVNRLIVHEEPIVSGHYQSPNEEGTAIWPVAVIDDGVTFKAASYEDIGTTGFIKVAAVGMGFTLIRREVIEALAAHREVGPLWPYAESEDERGPMGEDVSFCRRAGLLGFDSYIDLSIRVGHVKNILLMAQEV